MIRTAGIIAFTYAAMPASNPPPPTGTKMAPRSPGRCRTISSPTVPCPAITSGSSNGWMNVAPVAIRFLAGKRVGFGVRVAGQFDVGAAAAHRIHLDVRRRPRHDDAGAHAEVLRGHRDALRVVAGAGRDHAAAPFGLREAGHAVVGAANLEAEDRLEVFALEEHGDAEAGRQPRRGVERRLARDVVDAAGQDLANEGIERHWRTITGIGYRVPGSGHRESGCGSRIADRESRIGIGRLRRM